MTTVFYEEKPVKSSVGESEIGFVKIYIYIAGKSTDVPVIVTFLF